MINKAIEFATRAHAGQFRKGTRRPYIVHPIEVGDIVSTMTQDEEIISAAVLHDTIEDCEGVSREILAREFSERVAGISRFLHLLMDDVSSARLLCKVQLRYQHCERTKWYRQY